MEVVLHEILGEIRGMKSDISDLKAGQVRLDSRLERLRKVRRGLRPGLPELTVFWRGLKPASKARLRTRFASYSMHSGCITRDSIVTTRGLTALGERRVHCGVASESLAVLASALQVVDHICERTPQTVITHPQLHPRMTEEALKG
ncbi:MAG: hypothetical protein ACM3ZU_03865 [Bacteroidota bacterium]